MRPALPRLTARSTQRIGLGPPPGGTADPHLLTKEHRAWAAAVLRRANYQCQDPEHDPRRPRGGKLHADHIKERRDYPELSLDIRNGLARCVQCHVKKTLRERAKRMKLTLA
jgi:5-methylcytosine-specific restriction enzyme A